MDFTYLHCTWDCNDEEQRQVKATSSGFLTLCYLGDLAKLLRFHPHICEVETMAVPNPLVRKIKCYNAQYRATSQNMLNIIITNFMTTGRELFNQFWTNLHTAVLCNLGQVMFPWAQIFSSVKSMK